MAIKQQHSFFGDKKRQEEIMTERALEEHEVVEHKIINPIYEYEITLKMSTFEDNHAVSESFKKEAEGDADYD
uniref:Uncharacterized protein n=1 Tax=Tanacetum cinerariifolium TaxID=118510 RepID=A0A6L2NM42_TANCI|nr:hypothetical protein [Tanacetum cinerariifolium]